MQCSGKTSDNFHNRSYLRIVSLLSLSVVVDDQCTHLILHFIIIINRLILIGTLARKTKVNLDEQSAKQLGAKNKMKKKAESRKKTYTSRSADLRFPKVPVPTPLHPPFVDPRTSHLSSGSDTAKAAFHLSSSERTTTARVRIYCCQYTFNPDLQHVYHNM
ncbi:hypothetical protein BO85DRAFT_32972 [Aspergillus piperis CBS 112811]|uniref:Uncharacterized protein n=1 Tax=Aspergillus piperis CBS 112811 TaxID=1448313 RepID=A0A8G1R262_9EURO|nr:hypothetical protein BO85DRAFT_32972 [Aspergillus piperis CBS 112811]RAH57132.1 hypothetical protein BO85DRAFT_32972 [Aspergillus piperis CBS 112811]